jgi:PEP-CTERM motif
MGGCMKIFAIAVVVAATVTASAANAVVVADSLPYDGTPAWSDIVFAGTSMVVSGGESILTTGNNRGVWFGWQSGSNTPSWTIANNADGNYLSLTAKFSSGADDWSAYMHDGTRSAAMIFNETPCDSSSQNCYNFNGTPGVSLYFAGPTPGTSSRTFIALDTTQYFTYEWLLLGSTVTYRVNGASYSGTALAGGSKLMVIGDGSGSSLSGTGRMTVSGVTFDRAPAMTSLPSLVPEPGSWAMLIAGFGMIGAAMRRRNRAPRAVFA